MAATPSPSKSKTLIAELERAYPRLTFKLGESFVWSPGDLCVNYPKKTEKTFAFSLLHEVGHALLEHASFKSDLDLLRMERDAWDKAVEISKQHGIKIPHDHIERCVDTYRDWLYARSLCPNCKQCGLQTSKTSYACVFCSEQWKISESRLCKVTRRSIKKNS